MSLFDQIVARDRAASQSPPSRRKAFPQSTTGSQRRRHLTKPLRIHAGTGGVVSPSTSPRSSVAGDDEDLGHVQHHRYDRHNGHDGIDDHDDGEVEAEQHSQGEEHCANQHATDRQQQQQGEPKSTGEQAVDAAAAVGGAAARLAGKGFKMGAKALFGSGKSKKGTGKK